jgi:methionyl-tRNA formyltransferase
MKEKNKIVFFASGDFAIETFTYLVENGENVVGLVTTNDYTKYHKKTLRELAKDYRLPTHIVKTEKVEDDEWLPDFLKRLNADIFCVISFKKLPESIIKMAKKCAFNIHASLLPLLRGADPVHWAIRYGFNETGLSAILLNDKIDCGDILLNKIVSISDKDDYETLFKKLSKECVDFTYDVLNEVLTKDDFRVRVIKQPSFSLYEAPKTNRDKITTAELANFYGSESTSLNPTENLFRASEGFLFTLHVKGKDKNCKNVEFKDKIKIYRVKASEEIAKEAETYPLEDIVAAPLVKTDGKTFIKFTYWTIWYYIETIQLVGKKKMSVKDFLNGYRHFDYDDLEIRLVFED